MKLTKLIITSALALLIFLVACKPAGDLSLGPVISGHELGYILQVDPDFSASGTVVDDSYRLVRPEWVKANLNVASFGDCDDYAAKAFVQAQSHGRRVAFGMITSTRITSGGKLGGHAFNFFLDPDKEVWFYEPQTGRVWKPSNEELWMLGKYWI